MKNVEVTFTFETSIDDGCDMGRFHEESFKKIRRFAHVTYLEHDNLVCATLNLSKVMVKGGDYEKEISL